METETRKITVHTVLQNPAGLTGDCGVHITGRYNTGWLHLPGDKPWDRNHVACPDCEALS